MQVLVNIRIRVHESEDGRFTAFSLGVPSIASGASLEEALENIQRAVDMHLAWLDKRITSEQERVLYFHRTGLDYKIVEDDTVVENRLVSLGRTKELLPIWGKEDSGGPVGLEQRDYEVALVGIG